MAKQLLSSTSLRDFLSQRPPSTVVKVNDSDSLEQVLDLFASRNILSAPVVSTSPSSTRCLGFVAVDDILRAVLGFAGISSPSSKAFRGRRAFSSRSSIDAAVLASSTPASRDENLRRASRRLKSTTVREVSRSGDGSLVFCCKNDGVAMEAEEGGEEGEEERNGGDNPSSPSPSPQPSLLDIVRDGFLLGGSKGNQRSHRSVCHRVAVVDFEEDEDEDERGERMEATTASAAAVAAAAADNVVAIVSQSDVVRFLARCPEAFQGGEKEPTASELATSPVAAVPAAMPASLAFASLFEQQQEEEGRGTVSAAAIVGVRGGELVGCLSASDLRGLTPATLRALNLPVGEFVQARAAAAAVEGATSTKEKPTTFLAVAPETPLSTLVKLLAEGGCHRAFVVEEDEGTRRATGIVTLSDVLRFCVDEEK